jgi:hypothetical protein
MARTEPETVVALDSGELCLRETWPQSHASRIQLSDCLDDRVLHPLSLAHRVSGRRANPIPRSCRYDAILSGETKSIRRSCRSQPRIRVYDDNFGGWTRKDSRDPRYSDDFGGRVIVTIR